MENKMGNAPDQQEQSYGHRVKWTIMIYLAGDNNLSANSIAIMQELEAANHREDVHVLACFDSNTPRPKGARYLEINRRRLSVNNGMDWGLHNDLVPPDARGDHTVVSPDFCNPDPSSVHIPDEPVAHEGLSRFLTFALRYHRAERYMLILFGHGTAVAGNTFLADSNPPSFLRLKDFACVLEKHFGGYRPKLNILACHNCVMNGIEVAYQIRKQVDFMIGSEGLVLAAGWPYRKIINAVEKKPSAQTERVAFRVLKACARNLLDFALMDRSSEQALCDLKKFGGDSHSGIIKAVDDLADVLQKGLEFKKAGMPGQQPHCNAKVGELCYPIVCDAVRLARLEAQSYWDETFVDLYDFCSLLIKKCKDFLPHLVQAFDNTEQWQNLDSDAASKKLLDIDLIDLLLQSPFVVLLRRIICKCLAVIDEIKKFVPYSYYVGPELQYSHGLSIYFPWTLPEDPIIFDQTYPESNDFLLKTAFDEYKDYAFAKDSNWVAFLESFFRATLRNVRRFDYTYRPPIAEKMEEKLLLIVPENISEGVAPLLELHKTGSDVDREEVVICPTIKNYPRRFYLSPADCLCRCDGSLVNCPPSADGRKYCVSYLGWNLRGLVAKVIGLPTPDGSSDAPDMTDYCSEIESDRELPE